MSGEAREVLQSLEKSRPLPRPGTVELDGEKAEAIVGKQAGIPQGQV